MTSNVIVLNSKDKKIIRKYLESQFGINKLPEGIFFCFSKKDNVYFSNRNVFEEDQYLLRVKTFGLMFGTYTKNGFRLSIEGSQLVGPNASKNILELQDSERDLWISGNSLIIDKNKLNNQEIILKHKNDFFGTAFVKEGLVKNTLAKSRLIKTIFEENIIEDKS